jgi:hypothetical protein
MPIHCCPPSWNPEARHPRDTLPAPAPPAAAWPPSLVLGRARRRRGTAPGHARGCARPGPHARPRFPLCGKPTRRPRPVTARTTLECARPRRARRRGRCRGHVPVALCPLPPPPRRARARPSMWAAPCASAAPYLSKFLPTAPTGWMDGRALCVVPAPSIASMRHPRAAPVARRRGPRATPPSPPPRHPLGYTAPARAQAPPRAPPGAPAAARPGRAPSPPRPTTPGGPPQHCSTARADCNPRRVPPSLAKHTHLPIHTKPSPPRGASAGPLRPRCAPPARRRPASRGARQARAPPAAV